jgi:cobalt-precorrin 5A hydrolase
MERQTMIVAGFGFRKGASDDSLADALAQAMAQTGAQAEGAHVPSAFATLTDKAEWLHSFAAARHMPLISVDPGTAAAQTTLTNSEASQTHRSTGSVAEATALAAAGPGAGLLGPRSISTDRMATCAIALGDTP